MFPFDILMSIASIVQTFNFTGASAAGRCAVRALLGKAVFDLCHVPARVSGGGMLYRVGKHRRRDTLRFCLPDNSGGFLSGGFYGHVWLEVGDDLVDFASGDWMTDSTEMYATATDPDEIKLGPVEWQIQPPPFICSPRNMIGWRPKGQPIVGEIWYGPWSNTHGGPGLTNLLRDDGIDRIIEDQAMPAIRQRVDQLRLIERCNEASMIESILSN